MRPKHDVVSNLDGANVQEAAVEVQVHATTHADVVPLHTGGLHTGGFLREAARFSNSDDALIDPAKQPDKAEAGEPSVQPASMGDEVLSRTAICQMV